MTQFDPSQPSVLPLGPVVTIDAAVDTDHVHIQPARLNVETLERLPGMGGQRGLVAVSACAESGGGVGLVPAAARSLAVSLLEAADQADEIENADLGILLANSLFAGGDPGSTTPDIDSEGLQIGRTTEYVDHDGDKLLFSTATSAAADQAVITVVDAFDDESSLSVAVTRDQAKRLASLLLDFAGIGAI